MSKTSGTSHALAALVGMITGDLFLNYCRPHFPVLMEPLEGGAEAISGWFQGATHARISASIIAPAIVAFVIAFLWGVTYHRIRHRDANS